MQQPFVSPISLSRQFAETYISSPVKGTLTVPTAQGCLRIERAGERKSSLRAASSLGTLSRCPTAALPASSQRHDRGAAERVGRRHVGGAGSSADRTM